MRMDARYTGTVISERRKLLGMTQQELSERLNVTNKAVSKWETGKNFPDLTLLQPLSEVLGISIGELLGIERNISDDDIVVMAAISEQEKREIKRSLFYFVIATMLSAVLFLTFHTTVEFVSAPVLEPYSMAVRLERALFVINMVLLISGGALLEKLLRKFSSQRAYRWPASGESVLWENVKTQFSLWRKR